MKKVTVFITSTLFIILCSSYGQRQSYSLSLEQQDDPGYKLYKDGYSLVLEANWKDAQKKFEELLKLYPRSSYSDDAGYWKAYCLKYQDERKAIGALKNFLREFPRSSYRSDALEDLAELQTRIQKNIVVSGDSLPGRRFHVQVPDIQVEVPDIQIYQDWESDFPFGDRLAVRVFSDEIQDDIEWAFVPRFGSRKEKDLDENTKLKISALRGIAADRDSESFRTMRDILLDRTESPGLREEALRLLNRYQPRPGRDGLPKFDLLATLKHVAKNDPDQRLRHGAIYYIGKYEKDKDGAAGTLIELYTTTPKDSARLKERLLYSIARTRTDKGADFLVSVAKSEDDYKIRESALYWLGRYGEGKKKRALYEILKKK